MSWGKPNVPIALCVMELVQALFQGEQDNRSDSGNVATAHRQNVTRLAR